MKKLLAGLGIALALTACSNDDEYSWDDFSDKTATDTLNIFIAFSGNSAIISGDGEGYVTATGADVTVRSNTNKFLQLWLSGNTTDGSLLVYSWKKVGVVLNGVNMTNPDGPAINNQCSKSLIVTTAEGTTNTLSDGTQYAEAPLDNQGLAIDQKATLFSEGQIYFRGNGTLIVDAHAKNGIASDDYINVESGNIRVQVAQTGSNGIKVNDGMTITGGTLTIEVTANGARGIKNDARTTISGGQTTINTKGNCVIDTTYTDDVMTIDTTSCAGIKGDSLFVMTGGSLTITSSGDGGKGINCSDTILVQGGTLMATTTGSNVQGKPKAVKSDKAIILNGGYFEASCAKSWACDNGSEEEDPEKRVEVIGTPTEQYYAKKHIKVVF